MEGILGGKIVATGIGSVKDSPRLTNVAEQTLR